MPLHELILALLVRSLELLNALLLLRHQILPRNMGALGHVRGADVVAGLGDEPHLLQLSVPVTGARVELPR